MKLIYKGKYNGEIEEFESSKNIVNATKYKEADTVEEMAKIMGDISYIEGDMFDGEIVKIIKLEESLWEK